jgi:hypothetical protein
LGLSVALGCGIAAAGAGVLKFLLLPSQESYVAFSLLLGAFLVPGGALATLLAVVPIAILVLKPPPEVTHLLGSREHVRFLKKNGYNKFDILEPDGRRSEPRLKPDWSPDLLRS